MLVTKLDIDQKNSLYYEYQEGKQNSYTYAFVNALTGDTSAWNGVIGKRVKDEKKNKKFKNNRVSPLWSFNSTRRT